mgnify:CR=1 FL=1
MVYNDRVYIGDVSGNAMEVVLMNHELNIGTIGGYSADELVDRIVEVIPEAGIQKSWNKDSYTIPEYRVERSILSPYLGNVTNHVSSYRYLTDAFRNVVIKYDCVKMTANLSVSISAKTTKTGSSPIKYFVRFGDSANASGDSSILINSGNSSYTDFSIYAFATFAFYVRSIYDNKLNISYQYKISQTDSWKTLEPNITLQLTSDEMFSVLATSSGSVVFSVTEKFGLI